MLLGRSIENAGTVDQGQVCIAQTQLMTTGESQLVTLYGIDVASYQTGLNLAEVKAEGFDFLIAKATEGSSYVDPYWASFRDGAYANELILVGYHYVTLDAPAAQADNLVSALGDTGIPVILDLRPVLAA